MTLTKFGTMLKILRTLLGGYDGSWNLGYSDVYGCDYNTSFVRNTIWGG